MGRIFLDNKTINYMRLIRQIDQGQAFRPPPDRDVNVWRNQYLVAMDRMQRIGMEERWLFSAYAAEIEADANRRSRRPCAELLTTTMTLAEWLADITMRCDRAGIDASAAIRYVAVGDVAAGDDHRFMPTAAGWFHASAAGIRPLGHLDPAPAITIVLANGVGIRARVGSARGPDGWAIGWEPPSALAVAAAAAGAQTHNAKLVS